MAVEMTPKSNFGGARHENKVQESVMIEMHRL